jgi:hypothetical protein
MRWGGIFKGLSRDGGRADFSIKTTVPLSLMTTFPMSLIFAGSISLDSTFHDVVMFIFNSFVHLDSTPFCLEVQSPACIFYDLVWWCSVSIGFGANVLLQYLTMTVIYC